MQNENNVTSAVDWFSQTISSVASGAGNIADSVTSVIDKFDFNQSAKTTNTQTVNSTNTQQQPSYVKDIFTWFVPLGGGALLVVLMATMLKKAF